MKYGLIGPGRHGSRYLMPENGGDEISIVLRKQEGSLIIGKEVTTDLDYFIGNCDAAIIATPPDSHYDLALACLTSRMPILIEKPLALDYESCAQILDVGKRVGVPVMVAHTHLFHPRFEDIVLTGLDAECPVTKVTSVSGGPGPIRSYNALLDWGPHDVAMAIAAYKEMPISHEVRLLSEGTYSIQIEFPTGDADIVVSNRFPAKRRLFTLEHAYSQKVEHHLYKGDEPSAITPMANMIKVFQAAAEYQLEDYRSDPTFLMAVYNILMPEAEPKAKGN